MVTKPTLRDRFQGIIFGTAVGDALGLPVEGLSPKRAKKLFGDNWRHRFLLNKGMVSDDTDHTIFVAQSLLVHPNASKLFAKRLSWCFRWWFLSIPAGIGFATLRSILRLWVGFSPTHSGIYSAGNGPSMRSAPIGAFYASSPQRMDDYLEASTKITHTDPRALTGAKAVAYLTAWSVRENLTERPHLEDFLNVLRKAGSEDKEWLSLLCSISDACQQKLSVEKFAQGLGLVKGVTGYVYHTVPVASYSWFRHFGDFEQTLTAVLNCGGDTDTSGAIAGALAGGVVGKAGIPNEWIQGLLEWPRSRKILTAVADQLADRSLQHKARAPVRYFWPGLVFRNMVFMTLVLLHGFRRLAPPY